MSMTEIRDRGRDGRDGNEDSERIDYRRDES